jgi:hypothetical protein
MKCVHAVTQCSVGKHGEIYEGKTHIISNLLFNKVSYMHCCPGIGQAELCTQVGLDVRLCGRTTVVSDDDVSLHSVAAIHRSKTKICTAVAALDKKP